MYLKNISLIIDSESERDGQREWRGETECKEGARKTCAFYFLFVNNFKCKKNLVDINIIFFFLYIWLFLPLQK